MSQCEIQQEIHEPNASEVTRGISHRRDVNAQFTMRSHREICGFYLTVHPIENVLAGMDI